MLDMRSVHSFSAWSHLVAAVAFAAYGLIRVALFDELVLANKLATASVFVYAATFAISTLYHVVGDNQTLSRPMVEIDQAAVLFSLTVTIATDVSIACYAGPTLRVRAWVDIIASPVLTTVFFGIVLPTISTHNTWVKRGAVSKGTLRHYHSDLQHMNTRRGTALCVLLGWIPTAHLLYERIQSTPAAVLLAAYATGVVLVLSAQLNDATEFTDRWLPDVSRIYKRWLPIESHGVWHVVSTLATVFLVVAREYALASQRQQHTLMP